MIGHHRRLCKCCDHTSSYNGGIQVFSPFPWKWSMYNSLFTNFVSTHWFLVRFSSNVQEKLLVPSSYPNFLFAWLFLVTAGIQIFVYVSPIYLRCPGTLFISHEHANFLFSVIRVVQGEAKTPKLMGCCRAIFAFLHALKIGTFRGKWTLEWVFKTSHFFRLALYILINSKLAFSLHVSERCLTGTAKNFWFRAPNSVKNNFCFFVWKPR